MSKELNNMPTRDYLVKYGECLVEHIHHEEYELDGVVYVCGWRSPHKPLLPEEVGSYDGWIVWKKVTKMKINGQEDENE